MSAAAVPPAAAWARTTAARTSIDAGDDGDTPGETYAALLRRLTALPLPGAADWDDVYRSELRGQTDADGDSQRAAVHAVQSETGNGEADVEEEEEEEESLPRAWTERGESSLAFGRYERGQRGSGSAADAPGGLDQALWGEGNGESSDEREHADEHSREKREEHRWRGELAGPAVGVTPAHRPGRLSNGRDGDLPLWHADAPVPQLEGGDAGGVRAQLLYRAQTRRVRELEAALSAQETANYSERESLAREVRERAEMHQEAVDELEKVAHALQRCRGELHQARAAETQLQSELRDQGHALAMSEADAAAATAMASQLQTRLAEVERQPRHTERHAGEELIAALRRQHEATVDALRQRLAAAETQARDAEARAQNAEAQASEAAQSLEQAKADAAASVARADARDGAGDDAGVATTDSERVALDRAELEDLRHQNQILDTGLALLAEATTATTSDGGATVTLRRELGRALAASQAHLRANNALRARLRLLTNPTHDAELSSDAPHGSTAALHLHTNSEHDASPDTGPAVTTSAAAVQDAHRRTDDAETARDAALLALEEARGKAEACEAATMQARVEAADARAATKTEAAARLQVQQEADSAHAQIAHLKQQIHLLQEDNTRMRRACEQMQASAQEKTRVLAELRDSAARAYAEASTQAAEQTKARYAPLVALLCRRLEDAEGRRRDHETGLKAVMEEVASLEITCKAQEDRRRQDVERFRQTLAEKDRAIAALQAKLNALRRRDAQLGELEGSLATAAQQDMETSQSLQTLQEQYVRAVEGMRNELHDYAHALQHRAAEHLKKEALKERYRTALRLNEYYMSAITRLLKSRESDGDGDSNIGEELGSDDQGGSGARAAEGSKGGEGAAS